MLRCNEGCQECRWNRRFFYGSLAKKVSDRSQRYSPPHALAYVIAEAFASFSTFVMFLSAIIYSAQDA